MSKYFTPRITQKVIRKANYEKQIESIRMKEEEWTSREEKSKEKVLQFKKKREQLIWKKCGCRNIKSMNSRKS